jgi:ABC-type branched-subunit amino acid transport system substrate-binding protein
VSGPASIYPQAAQFIQDYTAKFGEPPQPFAAQAYDSAGIALHAIEMAAAYANDVPTRSAVAALVRATSGYEGITGMVTFDAFGDNEVAQYYIIEVGSSDPAKWSENTVFATIELASPLKALEQAMMGG